ncbi:hypothetical protein VC83_07823 [Pseudogymnoascus destructans]|uniref:Transcription factor domain-containing protein n=2 Tax=Pseudogymnoascus destructans TaxID=655981 RepID=L8FNR6_PSED2|nr:uncharacterized protein VC83_07823 [Pseudogymnoascus destructans]ELR02189.1 hypothetical protein GMDG_00982 [Pseudogymnoascus destructans 20631-21]OAF55750.1 hypothetical protein VC83_07823 [Pseudogymnoascus destructans]
MSYIQVEWMTAQDTGMEGYLVLGVTTRLAIYDYTCAIPRNISDDDFDDPTTELPPSEALEEATEASYTIVKGRLILVLGGIIELIGSRTKIRREDLEKHGEARLEARELIPRYLPVQPFTPTASDTATAKLQRSRIDVDSVYHLGRCLLFRKFVPQARRYPAAIEYRDNCIDAAMILLSHQAALALDHGATCPRNVQKRHFHRLTTHDFFLAAIIVAVDLYAEV